MANKQNIRDFQIFTILRKMDEHFADTYFKDAHWVRVPNAPYDTGKEHMVIYAAQSSAATALAVETEYGYEIKIYGW